MDERIVSAVRNSVLGLLSGSTGSRDRKAKASTPLRAEVIEAWGRCVGDPDSETIAGWLDNGAPLGYTQPIPCNGVFPKVEGIEWKAEALQTLARSLSGWQNYMSAVEEAAELDKLVEDYVKRGFCRLVEDDEAAMKDLGRAPVLNKLGVVVKWSADKKKSRVIWDLRESGANALCSQGERIVLPRLLDLAQGAVNAYRRQREPWLAAVDIRDAFMNVPAGEDKFVTTAALPNQTGQGHRVIIFDTLVFGAVSSPTLWGRVAACMVGQIVGGHMPEDHRPDLRRRPGLCFGWLSRRGQQGAYTFAPMGKCCRVPDKMGKGFGWEVPHVDRSDHHFV